MLDLLRIQAELPYDLLNYQLLAEVVDDHDSRPVDLPSIRLHFLREEGEVEALQEVGIRFEQYLRSLIEQKDQLLLIDHPLALHFRLLGRLDALDLQRSLEERMEVNQRKLGIEHAPIQHKGDYFAVLEQSWLRLCEIGEQVGDLGLVVFRKQELFLCLLHVSYINKIAIVLSLGFLLLMLALGLFEQPLEFRAEELVGRLEHRALPHYGGCFD